MKRLLGLALPALLVGACATPFQFDGDTGGTSGALTSANAKLDRRLEAILAKGSGAQTPGVAQKGDEIDVLIAADPAALPKLDALGVHVRTVTSSGVMTARVSLHKVKDIAALADVHHIEVAKKKTKSNDLGNGPAGLNTPSDLRSTNGLPAKGGAGVVVGIIDSGIDYKHADFRDANGKTRIKALWDQSDHGDRKPPSAAMSYGYAYSQADIDTCIAGTSRKAYCKETDVDGHGTHVTGTAAGNGRAFKSGTSIAQYQMAGVAPEADIVFVKFDFDGDRNTDAAIVDGVNWIFQEAAKLGKPAVINMSLGSDYGPHDGTTLEERGINDLSGPGKIVVVAAGNPGVNVPSANQTLWGWPLHGEGTVPAADAGYSEITFDVNAGATTSDYIFFSLWYPGGTTNRVEIITPSNNVWPQSPSTQWGTGQGSAGWYTSDGTIIVGNGGDQLGMGSLNGDHEIYVEVSGAGMPYNVKPTPGTWKVRLYGTNGSGPAAYNGWHGTSRGDFSGQPHYQGAPTNNAMTIGSPASAAKVLSIGAYATRLSWQFADLDPRDGTCTSSCVQQYGVGPLSYYDPFNDGDLAFFSARGPSRDGRQQPAVSAPGVGIISSLSQDKLNYEKSVPVANTYLMRTNRVADDQLHAVLQGTSMACPHATGAVALLLAKNKTLTPENARAALQATARHDGAASESPNNDWGSGRIDVSAARDAVCSADSMCADNSCCVNGGCGGAPACTTNADCGADNVCENGGTCAAKCKAPIPPPPACSGAGTSCTSASQCCAGLTCGGKPNAKTCR